MKNENVDAVKNGLENLKRHIENIQNVYNLPLVVAINKFNTDTDNEILVVKEFVQKYNIPCSVCTSFEHGSKGTLDLAQNVINLCKCDKNIQFAYDLNDDVETKIKKIASKIYHASEVDFSNSAKQMLDKIKKFGYDKLPVIIAKTQYSFSDDKEKVNAPENFKITITDLKIRGGAEFIVAIAGSMLLMPGLAKHSAYENMTIDKNSNINGLF